MKTNPVKILAFAGSTRKASFNKKLVQFAVAGAEAAGAQVTYIDLADYPLPVYDGDLEEAQGLPENALKLKKLFSDHQGLLIATPEYNSGYPGGLKNMIDWVSRKADPDEAPLACFKGKIASLMSTSPGALGGLRGLHQLREVLLNIHVLVLTKMHALPRAMQEFDVAGKLKNLDTEKIIKGLGAQTVQMIQNLGT